MFKLLCIVYVLIWKVKTEWQPSNDNLDTFLTFYMNSSAGEIAAKCALNLTNTYNMNKYVLLELLYYADLEKQEMEFPNGVRLPFSLYDKVKTLLPNLAENIIIPIFSSKNYSVHEFQKIIQDPNYKCLKSIPAIDKHVIFADVRNTLKNLKDNNTLTVVANIFTGDYSYISPIIESYFPDLRNLTFVKTKSKQFVRYSLVKRLQHDLNFTLAPIDIDWLEPIQWTPNRKMSFRKLREIIDGFSNPDNMVMLSNVGSNHILENLNNHQIKHEDVVPMVNWLNVYKGMHPVKEVFNLTDMPEKLPYVRLRKNLSNEIFQTIRNDVEKIPTAASTNTVSGYPESRTMSTLTSAFPTSNNIENHFISTTADRPVSTVSTVSTMNLPTNTKQTDALVPVENDGNPMLSVNFHHPVSSTILAENNVISTTTSSTRTRNISGGNKDPTYTTIGDIKANHSSTVLTTTISYSSNESSDQFTKYQLSTKVPSHDSLSSNTDSKMKTNSSSSNVDKNNTFPFGRPLKLNDIFHILSTFLAKDNKSELIVADNLGEMKKPFSSCALCFMNTNGTTKHFVLSQTGFMSFFANHEHDTLTTLKNRTEIPTNQTGTPKNQTETVKIHTEILKVQTENLINQTETFTHQTEKPWRKNGTLDAVDTYLIDKFPHTYDNHKPVKNKNYKPPMANSTIARNPPPVEADIRNQKPHENIRRSTESENPVTTNMSANEESEMPTEMFTSTFQPNSNIKESYEVSEYEKYNNNFSPGSPENEFHEQISFDDAKDYFFRLLHSISPTKSINSDENSVGISENTNFNINQPEDNIVGSYFSSVGGKNHNNDLKPSNKHDHVRSKLEPLPETLENMEELNPTQSDTNLETSHLELSSQNSTELKKMFDSSQSDIPNHQHTFPVSPFGAHRNTVHPHTLQFNHTPTIMQHKHLPLYKDPETEEFSYSTRPAIARSTTRRIPKLDKTTIEGYYRGPAGAIPRILPPHNTHRNKLTPPWKQTYSAYSHTSENGYQPATDKEHKFMTSIGSRSKTPNFFRDFGTPDDNKFLRNHQDEANDRNSDYSVVDDEFSSNADIIYPQYVHSTFEDRERGSPEMYSHNFDSANENRFVQKGMSKDFRKATPVNKFYRSNRKV